MASKRKEIRDAIEAERKASNHRASHHSRVWNQITAIACKQAGCQYRSVSVPAEGQGQGSALCDADKAKRMRREFYVGVPLPSERKGNDWPFDAPKSCLLDGVNQ